MVYKILTSLCSLFLLLNVLTAQDSIVLATHLGAIKGIKEGESWIFKGVPYAEPLTDETRFQPSLPKQRWRDTMDCRHFSSSAPQYGNKKNIVKGNENCLFLNINTPVNKPRKKMPVLVWVHGGGMTNGQGADMDGRAFSDRDGVVTVTINYRLGVLGFLYLDDVAKGISGNNGLLDLMMALHYIQENISAYGGDPKQVTVMGESAGAKLTSTLLLTPQSKGLFKQMVLESGGIQCVRDTVTAKAIRQRLLDTLHIENPLLLLSMPLEELVDAQNKVCGGPKGTNYFGPVADNVVIPCDYMDSLNRRNLNGLRFLLGSNKSESRLFMNMDRRLYISDNIVLGDWFGENGTIIDSAMRRIGKDSVAALLTEYMYAMHTHRLAKFIARKKLPIWLYRFDYDIKSDGATHAQELAYVWYRSSANRQIANVPLAKNVHQMWVDFIKGKAPAKKWKSYSGIGPMYIIDRKNQLEMRPYFYEDAQFPIGCFRLY